MGVPLMYLFLELHSQYNFLRGMDQYKFTVQTLLFITNCVRNWFMFFDRIVKGNFEFITESI